MSADRNAPDRLAVVTGASSGIGAATVRRFRSSGWDVVAVARREDRLADLARETGCDFYAADLTDAGQLDALTEFVAGVGTPTTLINNAGGARGNDSVETGKADDWRWMFEVNVIATQQMTARMLPLLRAHAREHGHADIVTVTSTAGHVAYRGGAGYNASKFAEHALMSVLRQELIGEPLRVIEIAPGMVQSEEFSLNRFAGDRSRADAVYQGVPDPLSPDDVALAIVQAVGLPSHVNLELVTVKPVAQYNSFLTARAPLTVK
ncbi:MAG: oxidoreductase [Frondihabitans sp.]|nr:oxidoreductase [Frondihabitans sp.]